MRRLLLLLLLFHGQLALASVQLTEIRVSYQGNHTRVVFSLNKATPYKVFDLSSSHRIVIDLAKTQWKKRLSKVDLGKTLIEDIRAGNGKEQDLRVLLALKQEVTYHVFWLNPSLNAPHRLVLDLTAKGTQAIAKQTATPPLNEKPKAILDADKPIPLRNLIVMIDPGHGGSDPGAGGPRGTKEKKVVLGIGGYLRDNLEKYQGITVRMTRSGDEYIPLRGRLDLARKYKADIFVSVHADAFKNSLARGASVYALSQRGATSESARWLAQKENESEMLGGAELANKSYLLRSILIDLSQTVTTNNGLSMGSHVLDSIKKITRLHSQKVGQAAFVVLKSPDIPSILVENGFISNPYEEANLRTVNYQQKLATAISEGIIAYFTQKMPSGTVFAANYQSHRNTKR